MPATAGGLELTSSKASFILIYTSDNFTLLSDNSFIKIMHLNSLGWNWQHQILCVQEKTQ